MDLVFDLGSADGARGHALVYFKNKRDPAIVVAAYVIVPPISFDISKYIPPMFASRLPQMESEAIPFVPLPPVPESMDSYENLRRTADLRGDDLVFAGDVDPTLMETTFVALNQAAQAYAALYKQRLSSTMRQEPELGVNEILYSLMPEKDKLSELAKLTGKLRYALDGSDRSQVTETVQEMQTLAHFLPEKYRSNDLIRVAQLKEDRGGKLAELYITRCYKILNEEYADIEQIDRTIRQMDPGA